MAVTEYPVGRLDDIKFVAILTRYEGRWVYCWHKRRESYEHPGGHVEPGETPMEAAKRELFEETGIREGRLIPLWDYEYIWENGEGRNNGRVYYCEAAAMGVLPKSEMGHTALFDSVPPNYTYDREDELRTLEKVERALQAYV